MDDWWKTGKEIRVPKLLKELWICIFLLLSYPDLLAWWKIKIDHLTHKI